MNGLIGFDHLRIHCIIGADVHERLKEQVVFLDVRVQTDFTKCVSTDHMGDTVNYVDLASVCKTLAETRQFHLLETFASEAADTILAKFPVSKVRIKIKKPTGLLDADYTVVELERLR